MIAKFFNLRGTLDKRTLTIISILGFAILLMLWAALSVLGLVKPQLLPPPWKVLAAYQELHFKDALVRNIGYSIYLNIAGYLEAIGVSLIIGFSLGLFPLFRGLFGQFFSAARFIPLTGTLGLFICWFGIGDNFKIQFLSLGILVYLIPVVIQRIDDVEQVFEQTAITLGATPLQRILHIYIPSVLSKLSDDIRVLTAISWTYVIYCEMVNARAGVGYLIYLAQRQSRVDKTFAVLFVIIVIGFFQDQFFKFLDRKFFPYKYL